MEVLQKQKHGGGKYLATLNTRPELLTHNVSRLSKQLLRDFTIFVSLAVVYGIGSRALSWNRLSFVSTVASKASQPFLYVWNQSRRVPLAGTFLLTGAGKLIGEAGSQFLTGLKWATETRFKLGCTVGIYVFGTVVAPTLKDLFAYIRSSLRAHAAIKRYNQTGE